MNDHDPFGWMKGPYDGFWTGVTVVVFGAIVWDSIKAWWSNPPRPNKPKVMDILPKATLRQVIRMDEHWILRLVISRSSEPYEQRIMLCDDGTAYRVDVRADGTEEPARVM